MKELERLENCGVVPVVVLEDADCAVDTAKALLAGGVDVMEITFRTKAAAESIRRVAECCPDILVGAGTVVSLTQCMEAVRSGAKFIVSPGYDEEVVSYCTDHGIAVTPGCVTPSEIMAALKHGCRIIKFFPANVYGGLSAMKALSGPFPQVRFIPTGGVNGKNLAEYLASPFVFAVGGSWMCSKADISARDYESITRKCRDARNAVLGYELASIDVINPPSSLRDLLHDAFGLSLDECNQRDSACDGTENLFDQFPDADVHITVLTHNIVRALSDLEKKGISVDMSVINSNGGRKTASCKLQGIENCAFHLLER